MSSHPLINYSSGQQLSQTTGRSGGSSSLRERAQGRRRRRRRRRRRDSMPEPGHIFHSATEHRYRLTASEGKSALGNSSCSSAPPIRAETMD
ncbi:unnamed protein product [Pleuronectes platessa]|uniref:Uncharacterized protein n=1 Tax=Pleuronectes platessa TaxID=8262 RepID=A0A9N7V8E2_PLEPL|nr:unnamed protein product [Pleuronectes platessa]